MTIVDVRIVSLIENGISISDITTLVIIFIIQSVVVFIFNISIKNI